MGAEWEYFKNNGLGVDEIKVSVHDNYVSITDYRINAIYLEFTFEEALRLAKFLMAKIHTGENEHEEPYTHP